MKTTFMRLVYAGIVSAVSLLTFGPWGAPVAAMVLAFWWLWRGTELLSHALAILVLLGLVAGLLLGPAVQLAREAALRNQCLGHLKYHWVALANYDTAEGHLPPLRYDPTGGGHAHSWRVAITAQDYEEVYRDYRFDLPWDDPLNRDKLHFHLHEMHQCPITKKDGNSVYLAVTGPETVWGDGDQRSLSDVADDPASTILCLESPRLYSAWNEPRDLTFDEAVELLTTPLANHEQNAHYTRKSYLHKPDYQRNVAMCDGSVHVLSVPLDHETAIALLTSSGGEEIDVESLRHSGPAELDWPRIGGGVAFLVVAMLPTRRQRSATEEAS